MLIKSIFFFLFALWNIKNLLTIRNSVLSHLDFYFRHELIYPSLDSGMINLYSSYSHYLFNIPIA